MYYILRIINIIKTSIFLEINIIFKYKFTEIKIIIFLMSTLKVCMNGLIKHTLDCLRGYANLGIKLAKHYKGCLDALT